MRTARRYGFTLIELAIALALGAAITAAAIWMIVLLIRCGDGSRQHLLTTQSLGRLHLQLQQELAEAAELQVTPGADWTMMIEQSGGDQVRYQPVPDGIQRELLRANEAPQRDVVALPGFSGSELSVRSLDGLGHLLQLSFLPTGGEPGTTLLTKPLRRRTELTFPAAVPVVLNSPAEATAMAGAL